MYNNYILLCMCIDHQLIIIGPVLNLNQKLYTCYWIFFISCFSDKSITYQSDYSGYIIASFPPSNNWFRMYILITHANQFT